MTGRYYSAFYGTGLVGMSASGGYNPMCNYTHWAKKEFKAVKPWCRSETKEKLKEIEGRTKNLRRLGKDEVEEIRQLLVSEAEWAFEKTVIEKFPFVVICPVPPYSDIWHLQQPSIDYIHEQEAWLRTRFGPTTYVAFPTSATGKHKECCKNVYFKKADDALIFKLSRI